MSSKEQTAKPSMADPKVVRGLFEMAAEEVLFRLASVSSGKMTADRAGDMDDALAKHLARALMGENPEFAPAHNWSGWPCARSLASVDEEFFSQLFGADLSEPDNPRILMVQAATVFYRAIYRVIRREIVLEGATQQSVRRAMAQVVDKYALAAMPAAQRAA